MSKGRIEYYDGHQLLIAVDSAMVPFVGSYISIRKKTYKITAISFAIDYADQRRPFNGDGIVRISQKRTCDGGRAMDDGQGSAMHCLLGYNNQGKWRGHFREIYPHEPCPKPRTIAEYIEAVDKCRKAV